LSSHKPKHDFLDDTKPTIFKVHEMGNPANKLGLLSICNMIPVKQGAASALNFVGLDARYQLLLAHQLHCLKSNQQKIERKAKQLHTYVVAKRHPHFLGISCDFLRLEGVYQQFIL
jgi:protein AbiQ